MSRDVTGLLLDLADHSDKPRPPHWCEGCWRVQIADHLTRCRECEGAARAKRAAAMRARAETRPAAMVEDVEQEAEVQAVPWWRRMLKVLKVGRS